MYKSLSWFGLERYKQTRGHIRSTETHISAVCQDAGAAWRDRFEFWHARHIANLITNDKFCIDRFWCWGVLTPPILQLNRLATLVAFTIYTVLNDRPTQAINFL